MANGVDPDKTARNEPSSQDLHRLHKCLYWSTEMKELTVCVRCSLRRVKMDQRKLTENQSTLVDMAKTQSHIETMVSDVAGNTSGLEKRVNKIEEKLLSLQRQLDMLPSVIVDRMHTIQSGYDRQMESRPLPDFRSISRLSPPRRRRIVPLSQPQSQPPTTQTDINNTSTSQI